MNEKLLDEFVGKIVSALGDNLVTVVLYGSAVTGDFHQDVSDLNVLCVLKQLGLAELEQADPAVDWWMKKKQPAPVLLSIEEIRHASDAFAIEFLDIRAAYRILHGEDVIASIEVDPVHHRYQIEHELRSRLLRLRERYLALQNDRRGVVQLMVDSLPTFATLFRHTLTLTGSAPIKKREIFQEAAARFGISNAPFDALLDIREGNRRMQDAEIRSVFEEYLRQITRTVEYVDQL